MKTANINGLCISFFNSKLGTSFIRYTPLY